MWDSLEFPTNTNNINQHSRLITDETREKIQTHLEKGKIIWEFDLYDYNLPSKKAYLVHQITTRWNFGNNYPENRDYLKIIGFTKNNEKIVYGYIYFMLYTNNEGLKLSSYIGSKVNEEFRNKNLWNLLMSIYLFYSYDNGYLSFETITKQRKLDLLYLMNKYGFRVKYPQLYENGDRITMYKNNMVVDIYRDNKNGIYFRFKTKKAEEIYRERNRRILWSEDYRYLSHTDEQPIIINPQFYSKLGWCVPNETYTRQDQDNTLVDFHLTKSGFSK